MIVSDMTRLIGHTPLLEVKRLEKLLNLNARVLVKLECCNPAGSVKDRAALSMIEDAEESGRLQPGGTIIEPTSGNTGIGLAAVAAVKGYRVILTMPETMSPERRKLLAAYGAEIVLTSGEAGMTGAVEKANELHEKTPGSILAGQFENPANPEAHRRSTAPEIWEDTEGKIDFFVSGIGTGGTITGIGGWLKKQNPDIRIVGFEPASSPLLTEGRAGAHGLQGIGANFVPPVLDQSVIDEIWTVQEAPAYACARLFARHEGLLVGMTAGAALHVAFELARKPENAGKTVVALLPDSGERYLSTTLFDQL